MAAVDLALAALTGLVTTELFLAVSVPSAALASAARILTASLLATGTLRVGIAVGRSGERVRCDCFCSTIDGSTSGFLVGVGNVGLLANTLATSEVAVAEPFTTDFFVSGITATTSFSFIFSLLTLKLTFSARTTTGATVRCRSAGC